MSTHEHPAVLRVQAALHDQGIDPKIAHLNESARTALDAANALGIEVGQVASSIVFRLPDDKPLLIITSGRHRVNTDLVAQNLDVEKLHRADAEFVRTWSGFAIGGVSPLGWLQPVKVIIDEALSEYEIVWAAAGHPHAVFPTSYKQLVRATGAVPMRVAED
jgi:prolyl-tRNA editing enzyme YbaK/EbsC (Cys-tRNA(Pro) deacylase)